MKKIPMILLAMFTLSGCDRQEMIYSFNHVEEASVDNEVENTESVDNIQAETEQAVDITTEEPEISDVYSGPTVTLAMVGDVLLHTPVEESCQAEDGSYDFSSLFANVKDEVQAADIAIVNQEVIIGGEELGVSGYPSFNAPYEVADALADTGFDVILHGTNHAMDQGKKGITNCLSNWEKKYPDIKILGINKSQDAQDTITVLEKNGIKIGMINYTDILNCKGDYNADGQYLVDMLDYDRLATLIQRTKEASDFVIVFPHWGTEYNLGTDASQTEQAAFLAAQGVDLVIGTHPHVVEPIDYIDRPDGGKMLIYYSLGNFQSLQRKEATLLGGMAKVTIKKDFKGARIVDFDMETLVTDYRLGGVRVTDYFDIITTYPWSKYSRAIAESGNIGNGNANFNLDYMFQLQAKQAAQVHEARQKAGLE